MELIGENVGNALDKGNEKLREELKKIFFVFYDKHVNEKDKNTCILKVTLSDALIFANEYKYFIDFENETSTREKCVVDIIF